MKQLKWYGIVFAILMLLVYAIGIYDFIMEYTQNQAYYMSQGYGKEVIDYFMNYPILFRLLWIINLVCGVSGPILFLFRKKLASTIVMFSVLADLILIIFTCLFRDRIAIIGIRGFITDTTVLFLTFLFYMFCRKHVE